MSDFDEIHQDVDVEIEEEASSPVYDDMYIEVPEPVVIRGTGNVTIFGLSSKFDSEFPSRLSARVAQEEFSATIDHINSVLREHMSVNFKWLLCGCICCCCTLGCSMWPVLCLTKRARHAIEKSLDYENNKLYLKLGMQWQLRKQCCDSSSMMKFVLLIQFIPKIPILRPD